ncbi:MAG: hypothetical protein BAJALOKI3v1_170013 [Promethearchaeota archaeon]|jgi:hypothetical protein|nr:MAG: hypothetical protein BAJALOKI3v1_170013 [Candidatus Lokiarchaeota archaeon]
MENLAKYRLEPIRKIFSQRIVKADGPSSNTLELTYELGLITREEYYVMKAIKEKQPLENLNENDLTHVLKHLIEKRLIRKINY